MKNNLPKYLGCKEDPIDPRDIIYEEVMGAMPPDMPRKYNVEKKYGKVSRMHQGSSLGCVAMGSSRYKEVKDKKETGKLIPLSPRFIYSQYYLANGGMYVRSAMKCLEKLGIPEERAFPTIRDNQAVTERWMRYRGDMTDDAYENAKIYKIKSYASIVSFRPEVIAQAIFENDGVVLGIKGINASIGHLIYWAGYDLDNNTFDIIDSYSPFDKKITYKNGKFYFNGSQISIFSMWTAVDLPNEIIEHAKDMYLLRRHPKKWEEVYALRKGARRHVANKQTLVLGSKDPDRYWIWEKYDKIPQATPEEWNATEEMAEIILVPSDENIIIKLLGWIKSLFTN